MFNPYDLDEVDFIKLMQTLWRDCLELGYGLSKPEIRECVREYVSHV